MVKNRLIKQKAGRPIVFQAVLAVLMKIKQIPNIILSIAGYDADFYREKPAC